MNGWVTVGLVWIVVLLFWVAVMSVVDQRREAERRKRWLKEMLDDLEER